MNKQSKSIDNSMLILTEEEIDFLTREYSLKYQMFKEINSILVASMLKDIVVSKESTILQVKSILDRKILTYLCLLVRNLNREEIIDEILIFYNSLFDSILNKLGFIGDINTAKREVLIEVVKIYEGQDDFIALYTRYANNIMHKISNDKIDEIISEITHTHTNTKIEDIALMGNSLNILYDIDLDDPNFIKFVILKFGYNGYYLDNDSIKNILSLTDAEFNKFMDKAIETMNKSIKVPKIVNQDKIYIKRQTSFI